MNTIESFFQGLGLNEKEQKVLLVLMKLGRAGIIEISKHTGFKRSTTYYLLDQLSARGLVTYIQSGNSRVYSPSTPQRIKKILSEKKEQIDSQMHAFSHLLPELSMLYGQMASKPRFTYYEGQLGVQEIFDDMLPGTKELLCVGEVSTFEAAVGEKYLEEFVKRRTSQGIWLRAIWVETKTVSHYPGSAEHLRNIRYAPEWFATPASLYLYRNKVAFVSSAKESFGVILESQDFNETMKSWFELMWLGSKAKD